MIFQVVVFIKFSWLRMNLFQGPFRTENGDGNLDGLRLLQSDGPCLPETVADPLNKRKPPHDGCVVYGKAKPMPRSIAT